MGVIAQKDLVKSEEPITCDCGKRLFFVMFTPAGVILECKNCKEKMRFKREDFWQRSD